MDKTSAVVRSELATLASTIEDLAYDLQSRLAKGDGILDIANELVKNSITLTFGLGELYAKENVMPTTQASKASLSRQPVSRFHNVRDSKGRFVRVR